MRKFIRKFKEKFKEFYAFRYLCYNLMFIFIGIILAIFADYYLIGGYMLVLMFIIWFILVALPNNKIQIIRAKVIKSVKFDISWAPINFTPNSMHSLTSAFPKLGIIVSLSVIPYGSNTFLT